MAKLIKTLSIKNYRQLKSVKLDWVGDVNLIVGNNNSGKSTLLELIRLFSTRGSLDFIEELLSSHGELKSNYSNMSDADLPGKDVCNIFSGRLFPECDGEAISIADTETGVSLQMEHIFQLEEVFQSVEGDSTSVTRKVKKVMKSDKESVKKAEEALEIRLLMPGEEQINKQFSLEALFSRKRNFLHHHVSNLAQEIPHGYVSSGRGDIDELAEVWDGIVLTPDESYVLKALRSIEPKVKALAFIQSSAKRSIRIFPGNEKRLPPDRIAVVGLDSHNAPVSIASMGDGISRVLQLSLSALKAKNGFFLIDEFENGLHYSVQKEIWQLIFDLAKDNGMQVFATTHSNDCIRAFTEVANNCTEIDGGLIKFERKENGDSAVSFVNKCDLDSLVAMEVDVR